MILFDGAFTVVGLAVWAFCLVDVITTPRDQVRTLPKIVWVLLILLLTDLGAIAWLVAGRRWGAMVPAPTARPVSPDDDEEFIAQLRARADEQRRRGADGGDAPA